MQALNAAKFRVVNCSFFVPYGATLSLGPAVLRCNLRTFLALYFAPNLASYRNHREPGAVHQGRAQLVRYQVLAY